MVRQILLTTGLALSASAFAGVHQTVVEKASPEGIAKVASIRDHVVEMQAKRNDGSVKAGAMQKVSGPVAQWKRPAGQFWGTGYDASDGSWNYLTPLFLRPWVDYTFENISTGVSGQPSWSKQVYSPEANNYDVVTSDSENESQSFLRYELCAAPRLSYKNAITYPTQFDGMTESKAPFNEIMVYANDNTHVFDGTNYLVSSHFWGMFTRDPQESAYTYYRGATAYPGMDNGYWFGTNATGINAMATRFEKPDSPYLLNAVHWFYFSSGPIPANIPLTAYVFKTANDAAEYPDGSFGAELGDLIAVAESYVPASTTEAEGTVMFEFKEKNPVTGAETNISLEIEDDIIVLVTGFDANPGNGTFITTIMSTDTYDEGYGNLGFLGSFNVTEDGNISYGLNAINNFFTNPMPNTTLGVLADVSYPWVYPYLVEQPSEVFFPNEEEVTEDGSSSLEYLLYLMATSETADFDITFNGEEECDWLEIVDVYDEYDVDENGDEVFTGMCGLAFAAAPNPTDANRTCVVKISIPAASYEITFLQGSNNNAVEIVGVDKATEYFDLQGRRVANPDKGIYIKKAGNKTEKVIL